MLGNTFIIQSNLRGTELFVRARDYVSSVFGDLIPLQSNFISEELESKYCDQLRSKYSVDLCIYMLAKLYFILRRTHKLLVNRMRGEFHYGYDAVYYLFDLIFIEAETQMKTDYEYEKELKKIIYKEDNSEDTVSINELDASENKGELFFRKLRVLRQIRDTTKSQISSDLQSFKKPGLIKFMKTKQKLHQSLDLTLVQKDHYLPGRIFFTPDEKASKGQLKLRNQNSRIYIADDAMLEKASLEGAYKDLNHLRRQEFEDLSKPQIPSTKASLSALKIRILKKRKIVVKELKEPRRKRHKSLQQVQHFKFKKVEDHMDYTALLKNIAKLQAEEAKKEVFTLEPSGEWAEYNRRDLTHMFFVKRRKRDYKLHDLSTIIGGECLGGTNPILENCNISNNLINAKF